MCGIAGVVSHDPERSVREMLGVLEHRGRDDQGIWTSPPDQSGTGVSLGHRRLAIIDTSSAGHQPMFSADGRFVITFNGEIYNYRELREYLKAKGRQFHTDTDTEVLLEAFGEWGIDCLTRLNGMFAFAVWDQLERTLTLARDHVGIKPLYYSMLPSRNGAAPGLIFASEIKAILATRLVRPQLNVSGLHQYLTFLWCPEPDTLFDGIKQLPAANALVFRDGQIETRQWWDISYDNVDDTHNEKWWQERLLETLSRVVRLEMVADVPLGAFLSGGIDSSGIVALMKQHSNGRPVSTYTAGISSDDLRYDIIPDDLIWARRVNAELATASHEIMLKPNIAELLPKLVYHMDEPPIDMAIPSYLISNAARQTLTVMLSGMGGDEVFAGYPRQMAMKIAASLDPIPGLLRRPLMKMITNTLPGGRPGRLTAPLRNAKKFARSAALDFEDRYLGFGTYFSNEAKDKLYVDELRKQTAEMDPYSQHRTYFARVQHVHPLNQLLYVDLKTFLPCLNLITTDKTSMAANLEVRVPFLNREMLELSARIPPTLKLHGLKRKYILKRSLERLLPRDVIWRRKAGFGAPIRSWLRGSLSPLVNELLSEANVRQRGLFQPAEVRRIVEANLSGREDFNLQVFQLLTLELWQRQFLDGK